MSDEPGDGKLRRREFLETGAAAGLALGLLALPRPGWSAPPEPPRIRRHRRLGRTGLEISDISYGSSRTSDPAIVSHALDRGINYLDTAESYKDGDSETAIGKALEGRRNGVLLATKVECQKDTRRDELMKRLEGSLRRLRTDHVDVYFNHAVNDPERLRNDEWYEFARLAKSQGKIRFTGMSGHGGRLVECLDHAIDHDLVDVILCAYNFGQDPAFYQRFVSRLDFVAVQPELPRVLEKARGKDIGVIAMKTLRGARLNDMRPYEFGGATFAQAAFRWTLSDPRIDALVVSMTSAEQVDEYVAASGAPAPGSAELDLLERYELSSRDGYCNHGCGICETSCPQSVAIPEVLRTRMYAADYGDLAYARADYARLGGAAAACLSCSATPCSAACPRGLAIAELTRSAHALLG